MKNFRKEEEAVSPVIAIILMVAITVVLAGVLYVWVIQLADTDGDTVEKWFVDVKDGKGNATIGCLFVMEAGDNVKVDPTEYNFYVGKKDESIKALDWTARNTTWDLDYGGGGDDATTYSSGEVVGWDVTDAAWIQNLAHGDTIVVQVKRISDSKLVADADFTFSDVLN